MSEEACPQTFNGIVTDAAFLSQVSQPYTKQDAMFSGAVCAMKQRLNDLPHALGVAAIQVGVPLRVFVWREQTCEVVINPRIIEAKDLFIYGGEGCLSLPGEYINTLRYRAVLVTALGWQVPREYTGQLAVAVQHEIDHMDGILMLGHKAAKPGRNEPCPCGSGKKAKHCCLDAFMPEYRRRVQ